MDWMLNSNRNFSGFIVPDHYELHGNTNQAITR